MKAADARRAVAVGRFDALADSRRPVSDAHALIGDADWAAALIEPLIAAPLADWPVAARRSNVRATLLLARHRAAALSIAMFHRDASRETLVAGGRLTLARVLSGRGHVERRLAGPVRADFTAADAPRLAPCRSTRFGPGAILRLDGRRDCWRLCPDIGGAVLLVLTLEHRAATVMRAYHGPDGTLARVTASEGAAARAAMLVAMLDALRIEHAGAAYAAAATHPAFFVRWQAMRAWCARNPADAAPRLRRMAAADPHPEVRAAAAEAARRIDQCPG